MQELEAEARQIQAKNKVHIFNSVSNLPWNSLLRYMMYSYQLKSLNPDSIFLEDTSQLRRYGSVIHKLLGEISVVPTVWLVDHRSLFVF